MNIIVAIQCFNIAVTMYSETSKHTQPEDNIQVFILHQ